MFSLDTPQFIGRDSEFLIVIIMTGMGIKWSGEARKEELDKSVPTHFQFFILVQKGKKAEKSANKPLETYCCVYLIHYTSSEEGR